MTLSAGQIIEAARYSHPSFDRGLVPSSVAARFVNEAQRKLLVAAHQRNPTYLVRRWLISLLPGQNIAQVGSGTGVGAPLLRGTTSLQRSLVNTGSLATVPDSSVLNAERTATSYAATGLTDSTQSWTPSLFVGQMVEIISGTGAGQVRDITANGANTLSWTEPMDPVPDATSTYQVNAYLEEVSGAVGVSLGAQPSVGTQNAWLVRLDAQGQPYLDLASPVSVPITEGIPLPPNYFINHGLVRFQDYAAYPDGSAVLTLSTLDAQVRPPGPYCAAVVGETLQLFRPFNQWHNVAAIEIPYLPLAPSVVGADDLLLLPETAEEALVARVALRMAERSKAMGRLGDPSVFLDIGERAQEQEALYLDTVAGVGRATVGSIVEVW